MSILTTVTFRFVTPADVGAVWRALTFEPRHFRGLALQSDWEPGSRVRLTSGLAAVEGEVLHRADGARLSYTLGDHPSRPEVYVTWTLTEVAGGAPESGGSGGAPAGGTIVELGVDEVSWGRDDRDGRSEEVAEIEAAWQPVVDALRAEIELTIR